MRGVNRRTKMGLLILILVPIVISTIGLTTFGLIWRNSILNSVYSQGEIIILEDRDFSKRYQLPGIGTVDDPFIIENRIFEQSNKVAIVIMDTTKHFVIRNCTIKNSGQQILINNIGYNTGKICNNSFIYDYSLNNNIRFKDNRRDFSDFFEWTDYFPYPYEGFCQMNNAPGIRFENNQVYSINGNYTHIIGIGLISSDYTIIKNNNITNYHIGLCLCDSFNINIESNICTKNGEGIYLDDIKSATCFNNFLANNTYGIDIVRSQQIHFNSNCLVNNSNGLLAYNLYQSIITDNLISRNYFGIEGKFLGCNITENFFEYNTNYAIFFNEYNCNNNSVFNNVFSENNIQGILDEKKQAIDKNTNSIEMNFWYDIRNQLGNYWSDLVWNEGCNYILDGGGLAIDLYPLMEQPFSKSR